MALPMVFKQVFDAPGRFFVCRHNDILQSQSQNRLSDKIEIINKLEKNSRKWSIFPKICLTK
jgi:hypothetical protein